MYTAVSSCFDVMIGTGYHYCLRHKYAWWMPRSFRRECFHFFDKCSAKKQDNYNLELELKNNPLLEKKKICAIN